MEAGTQGRGKKRRRVASGADAGCPPAHASHPAAARKAAPPLPPRAKHRSRGGAAWLLPGTCVPPAAPRCLQRRPTTPCPPASVGSGSPGHAPATAASPPPLDTCGGGGAQTRGGSTMSKLCRCGNRRRGRGRRRGSARVGCWVACQALLPRTLQPLLGIRPPPTTTRTHADTWARPQHAPSGPWQPRCGRGLRASPRAVVRSGVVP
jgi:hypothetical protein